MSKITRISSYEQLTDEELIAEVKQRRREIQQPKLDFRDGLSNFLVSIPGIGGSVASVAGFIHLIVRPFKEGYVDKLQELSTNWKKKGRKEALKKFYENKDFKQNLQFTGIVFAITSIVSLFAINKIQRSERSEDNATKHMFGKDELFKRGYVQTKTGDFVKMHSSAEVRAEQQKILHRVDELEKSKTFQDRETDRNLESTENSPSIP